MVCRIVLLSHARSIRSGKNSRMIETVRIFEKAKAIMAAPNMREATITLLKPDRVPRGGEIPMMARTPMRP